MNTLHRSLEGLVTHLPTHFISELIASKIAAQGIILSEKQKDRLRQIISREDLSHIRIPGWKWWKSQQVEIEITADDIASMEREVDGLVNRLPQILAELSDQLALNIFRSLQNRWRAESRRQCKEIAAFEKRLGRRWKSPVELLSMLLTIAREFGDQTNARLRGAGESLHLVEVLTRLHARSCQVTSEIITLLRSGFGDGAIARWRTLHEIAVTALFLTEHGEDVAERYLLHEKVESHHAAAQYEKYYQRLGCEPLDPQEINELRASCADLIRRYGREFSEPYGWAAGYVSNQKPTFAAIEQEVGIDHLRPYYKMASHNVHANPKGVLFKLGLLDQSAMLLAGPSNTGLADAGQNAAISLTQVSVALGQLEPTLDTIVVLKILERLSDEVGVTFVETQARLESSEATHE